MPYVDGLFPQGRLDLVSMLDAFPVGVLIVNTGGRIVLLNRSLEALIGFPREDVIGRPCHSILRAKACIKSCPLLALKGKSEPLSIESDLINYDRQLVPIRINASSIEGTDGQFVGCLEVIEDLRSLQGLQEKRPIAYSFSGIIGKSPEMEKIFRILPVLAESDSSILITGETGTGKDIIAEAIHQASNRAKGPFIKVNCGALPETLLESELFGHTKGAFTGAIEHKSGRFRMAHNGTLYLTEIGDLPLPLQVKLLTFLDDKTVYPIGSTQGFQVDVRIIAATHRDLEQMVTEGSFREDLFFRLNVVRLHLPPVRDRGDDVLLLLDHFLRQFSGKFDKKIKGFSHKTLRILKRYPWPGNVRELRNVVEYAVNVCDGDEILPRHLPSYLMESNEGLSLSSEESGNKSITSPFQAEISSYATGDTWSELERKLILDALVKAKGRRNEAARHLGWSRSTLWRKMKQYKIA